MSNGRLWQVVTAVVVVLIGIVGWLLTREFERIDERLDRITDYVLEHRLPEPTKNHPPQ